MSLGGLEPRLEADRACRTMTAGAVGGRKGGTVSANKRLRKALSEGLSARQGEPRAPKSMGPPNIPILQFA